MTLAVVGDLLEDVVVVLDEATRPGGDASARIARRRGGSAANVAATAARLGAPTTLITAVGDDATGRALTAALESDGVAVRAATGPRTGSVVVIVELGGQRTMYPDRAAAAHVRVTDADLVGVDLVHVPAYGFLPPPGHPAPLAPLAQDLRRRATPLTIDVSSVQVVDRLGSALVALLRSLRPLVVFANEDEASALGWARRRAPAGLDVVVKRGPEPALLLRDGSCVEVPAAEVGAVVDTTGAGDAFAAGYVVAVLAGQAPPDAVAAGHRAAADHLRRLR